MDSNFSRSNAFQGCSYQGRGYLKRKREDDNVDAQPSIKRTEYLASSPKKFSVNNRLQQYRNVLQSVSDSKSVRLYHMPIENSSFTSVNNETFKDSKRKPASTLENRLSGIRNNQTNTDTRPSTNVEDQLYIAKPLKTNLPDTSVDYKRKCMEYLQSNTSVARAPTEKLLPTTPLASYSSEFSSSSSASYIVHQTSHLPDNNNFNETFKRISDNSNHSSVSNCLNSYVPHKGTNRYEEIANQNKSSNDEDMFMDWAPFDEKIVLSNIEKVRTSMVPNILPHTEFQKQIQNTSPELLQNDSVLKTIFIVVDTNIFLSHLEIVKEIMEIKINGVEVPIIFLPWIVIQELDYIKDGKSAHEFLQRRARIAIKFINACLQSNKKVLQGQNISDVMENMTPKTNADDAILNCCLQILRRKNRVILLSNDVNLRNKALINNVPTYGHDEIVTILDPFRKPLNEKCSKIEDIKTNLSHLVSLIIMKEMKLTYGNLWNKMGGMSKPPWLLEDCLDRLLKYWTSVFRSNLQKNAKDHFQEFKKFIINGNSVRDKETFFNYCLSLCTYLRNGYPNYKESINECVKNIKKTQKSL